MTSTKVVLSTLLLFTFLYANSQSQPKVSMNHEFNKIEAIRDKVSVSPEKITKPIRNQRNKTKPPHNFENSLPIGVDPIAQEIHGRRALRSLNSNWDGLSIDESGGAGVPDPSGAVNKDYYVEMTNIAWCVYDRQGNKLMQPQSLSQLFPNSQNSGDPIVMYDEYADRWFVSQFQTGNDDIVIAISQTSDPLGAWYQYAFSNAEFPDYPKFSVWPDGYYMTSNKGGENAVVYEREKMIAGDPTARQVQLFIPNIESFGFYCPLSADADGILPPVGSPCPYIYYQDDGWNGGTDNLTIWDFSVDWVNPANSTILTSTVIEISPFDSDLGPGFNSVDQPGTSTQLDGIEGALMYRLQHRGFADYRAMVGNFAVNVDGNGHIGIRWFELRNYDNGSGWQLYQEGTYAPDEHSRWMGGISLDASGNIGLGFNIGSSTMKASIKYTGRLANDPLGQMTFTEETIMEGEGVATFSNRFGDYSQLVVDPVDDLTFWFVTEYFSANNDWNTRVASFKIASDFPDDIGVSDITTPVDNSAMTSTEAITIKLKNYGANTQTNFGVSYQINNGQVITEQYTGSLATGTEYFTFQATANFSSPGTYSIKAFTTLTQDSMPVNNVYEKTVLHPFQLDASVINSSSPNSGINLNNETVTVEVTNFGTQNYSNLPISYSINGGAKITETISSLNSEQTITYSFSQQADLTAAGVYNLAVFIDSDSDQNLSNDTINVIVNHHHCIPTADCSIFNITNFNLFQIDNSSGCEGSGYSDFTNLSTRLLVNESRDLIIGSNTSNNNISFSLWIDYNDNLVFEPSEAIFLDTTVNTIDTFKINTPADANFGYHVLRARTVGQGTEGDPCITVSLGETEDYTVLVTNTLSLEDIENEQKDELFVRYQSEDNSISINVLTETENLDYTVHLYNIMGQRMNRVNRATLNQNNKQQISVEGIPKGTYIVVVNNGRYSKTEKVIIY
jgi:hypothetical protein